MKSPDQVIAFIGQRLAHIYERPLMYGGTPEGVELLLLAYHELWAEITERRVEFAQAERAVSDAEDCGSMGFATRCRRSRPTVSPEEAAQYIVSQWRKIGDQLGISLPAEKPSQP